MGKSRFAVLVFATAALVGPLLRFITWPPSRFREMTSAAIGEFVRDLVLLLWPTQILALGTAAFSLKIAALSIGGNLVLFTLLGLVVAGVARRRGGMLLTYVGVGFLLLLFALWFAGFRGASVNWFALLAALLIYAIPFWLVMRAPSMDGSRS